VKANQFTVVSKFDNGFIVQQTKPGDTDLQWSHDLGRMTAGDAEKHVAKLDLGGFTDWRLPTVEELFLLADRTKYGPAIDTESFPDCRSDWYLTSSPDPSDPAYVFVVHFYHGYVDLSSRHYRFAVRAVRSVARASQ